MTLSHQIMDFVSQRDHRLMRCVNRWSAPRWVRIWMICATRGGDGWLWGALLGLVFVFGGTERSLALRSATCSAGVGIVLFSLLKRLTGRKRPCVIEPHCWASLLPPDQFSFPSGHSITAFAITTPMVLIYPSLQATLLFIAISVAVSRVVLGMHFLSDVVVGIVLGGAIGYSAYLALL